MIFSCAGVKHINGVDGMQFLISDYYRGKLFLIKTDGRKTIDETQLIDLYEIRRGSRIFQAGFLTPDTVYIVFEGSRERLTEATVYLRIYDTVNST